MDFPSDSTALARYLDHLFKVSVPSSVLFYIVDVYGKWLSIRDILRSWKKENNPANTAIVVLLECNFQQKIFSNKQDVEADISPRCKLQTVKESSNSQGRDLIK
ncbi:hypothetical protein K0M31_011894 [Melipona bicolor]|uniref:Uncharacterized protein n=1 Tax=Melipona bicolor TaxID=60889 RepID=A0AA40GBN6_9HYME|nr:hypothetical protein K0M31_011894 [Melipona bicolor]